VKAERITVGAADAGQRLDRLLALRRLWGSRSQVQRLIGDGAVRLDGAVVKAGSVVRAGQVVEVRAAGPQPPPGVEPEEIALHVLYEDDWLLVIDKPAGLVVHPAPGHWRGTLVSALLHHWQGAPSGLDPLRPGIVHRLDKDTSGVLVIAKDAATLAELARQFKDREVDKQYVAVVWGSLRSERGTIAHPIARHPAHRKRMAVRAGGREAVTRYEVLERFDALTFVRLFPRTGRTHQLRVHLAAIGHPIVGDLLYGRQRRGDPRVHAARQALHAERISFRHPRTGQRVSFSAPLPDDMALLRRRLRAAAA
jgi:23S rRNA pseudouridine1911/1915/1917 synthase